MLLEFKLAFFPSYPDVPQSQARPDQQLESQGEFLRVQGVLLLTECTRPKCLNEQELQGDSIPRLFDVATCRARAENWNSVKSTPTRSHHSLL